MKKNYMKSLASRATAFKSSRSTIITDEGTGDLKECKSLFGDEVRILCVEVMVDFLTAVANARTTTYPHPVSIQNKCLQHC
jgi:hypothetical protein